MNKGVKFEFSTWSIIRGIRSKCQTSMAGDVTNVLSASTADLNRRYQSWSKLTALVDDCTLPALSKNCDEYERSFVDELGYFFDHIQSKLSCLIEALKLVEIDKDIDRMNLEFAASIILLLYELKPNAPWSRHEGYSEYYETIRDLINNVQGFHVHEKFSINERLEKFANDVFIICMERLHRKLTKESWKRHPGMLHCYRSIVNEWTENHKISCSLPLVFPGIFLQIDDYEENNKVKGLHCCYSVLKNVVRVAHKQSGYEIVIYNSLFKYIRYTEISIVNGGLQCMVLLLPLLSTENLNSKWSYIDDVFEAVLDALSIETVNIKQKIYWKYLTQLISMSTHSAIRWKKKIFLLLYDGLESRLSSAPHSNIKDYMNCLESWLKVGWPSWNYSTDKKFIFLLFKFLYHYKKVDETQVEMRCLLLMFSFCNENQKKYLLSEEYTKVSKFPKEFQETWELITENLKKTS